MFWPQATFLTFELLSSRSDPQGGLMTKADPDTSKKETRNLLKEAHVWTKVNRRPEKSKIITCVNS